MSRRTTIQRERECPLAPYGELETAGWTWHGGAEEIKRERGIFGYLPMRHDGFFYMLKRVLGVERERECFVPLFWGGGRQWQCYGNIIVVSSD